MAMGTACSRGGYCANETASGVPLMGKGILLWLIGVPIPVILLLWLFFH
jgi:hypothetical protein